MTRGRFEPSGAKTSRRRVGGLGWRIRALSRNNLCKTVFQQTLDAGGNRKSVGRLRKISQRGPIRAERDTDRPTFPRFFRYLDVEVVARLSGLAQDRSCPGSPTTEQDGLGTIEWRGKLQHVLSRAVVFAGHQETPFGIDADTVSVLPDRDFITKQLKTLFLGELCLYVVGYVELHRQLESELLRRPPPNQILEIPGAFLYGCLKATGNHVPEECDDVQQRALAARVGAYQDVEAVQRNVHVAQATVVPGLDAADHGASLHQHLLAPELPGTHELLQVAVRGACEPKVDLPALLAALAAWALLVHHGCGLVESGAVNARR